MAYQKKQGLRYIGKTQKKVLWAMTDSPMTRNGLIEKTRMKNQVVQSALKGLLYKGYIERHGHFFRITNLKNDAESNLSTVGGNGNVDRFPYPWDIKKGL